MNNSSDYPVIKNTYGQSQLEIGYKENVMLSKEINLYRQTFQVYLADESILMSASC